MKTFGKIIVGTCISLTALGIWDIKSRADKRDAYFANLPAEIVCAGKYGSAWEMYKGITKGLSDDKRPTANEFYEHACKINRISRDTLERHFGSESKVKQLMLPDYDGRPND